MSRTEADLRLRLAARTLIEWNTPITAPEHQRVLAHLLRVHPFAASWGLRAHKDVLKLDERGTVLWYLSETMDAKRSKPKGSKQSLKLSAQNEAFLEERGIEGLINFGVLGASNERLWAAGPTRTQAADAIYEAVKSEEAIGYESLLAVTAPLEPELQEASLRHLIESRVVRSGIVDSLSRVVNGFYSIILAAQSTLTILSGVVGLLSSLVAFSFGTSLVSGSSWFFIIVAGLGVVSVSLTLTYRIAIQKRITNVVASFSDRIDELPRELHRLGLGSRFYTSVGRICGTNARILISLVKTHPQDRWPDIALAATRNATPDVVGEVLIMIRDPEVNETMREKLFQWLCRVNVIRS